MIWKSSTACWVRGPKLPSTWRAVVPVWRGAPWLALACSDLESRRTEEDVEALLQEDDRLSPGVPNHQWSFDEIFDR